jgi:hypothetical protein
MSWGTIYDIERDPLPFGRSWAVVTLIGERNISLSPVRILLQLNEDGTSYVKQQSIEHNATDNQLPQPKNLNAVKPVSLGKISFDYVPRESPFDHGWSLAKEDRPGIAPIFSSLPPGAPLSVGLSIKSSDWYGMDYIIVEAQSTRCNTLIFKANFDTDSRFYVHLELPSRIVGKKAEQQWIQFGINRGPARIDGGEGIVTIRGKEPNGGWDSFDVSLDDVVEATFGARGLTYGEYGKLLKIRMRGSLSISEIELLRC